MTLDAAAKYTMTVADYSGVRTGALVHADFAETVIRAGHPTPAVDAPAGSWVVSYWADKSAATTGFALPGSVTGRQAVCAARAPATSAARSPTPTARCRPGSTTASSATADSANGDGDDLVDRPAHASSRTRPRRRRSPSPATARPATSTASTRATRTAPSCRTPGTSATAAPPPAPPPSHDFVTSGHPRRHADGDRRRGHAAARVVVPVSVVRTNAAPTASFTTSCTLPGLQLRRGRVRRQRRQRHVVRLGLRRRRDRHHDQAAAEPHLRRRAGRTS